MGSDKVIQKYKYKNTKGGGSFPKRGSNDDLTEVEFQNLKFIERTKTRRFQTKKQRNNE